MGILSLFKNLKKDQTRTYTTFNELGTYKSFFGSFGTDIYASQIVRSCIRALSEHTSKANPVCTNKQIERLLSVRPNQYMNGKAMLAKLRTILEIKNTAFLYIERDSTGAVVSFYPVPFAEFTPVEYNGGLFIQFTFMGMAANTLVLPWEDLAVLRKDFVYSDIGGEGNGPLLPTLDVIKTMDEGLKNAVKSTANLRGILKSTKAMLAPEALRQQKEDFVKDYLNLENEGGIASLDATQEFKEIKMEPKTGTSDEAKAYKESIYAYFGISEKIVVSDFTESQYDAFYESRIEPFLVDLSLELTGKVFTPREISFGNQITFESNRLQYASARTKISMVQLVDRGLMTPNEYRQLFNMAPYEGGDEFVLRLDTAKTGDTTTEGDNNGNSGE
jgi:HK97 family phage portal protein